MIGIMGALGLFDDIQDFNNQYIGGGVNIQLKLKLLFMNQRIESRTY